MPDVLATRDSADARLAARYDRAAPGWARNIARLGYPEAYRALACRGVDTIRNRPAGDLLRVLDAGCGAGDFARAVALSRPFRTSVDLVDLSPAMLMRASAALGKLAMEARLICGSLEDAPLDPSGYDLVLCAHLIEHVEDPLAILARLRSALIAGGALLLVANQPHWCTRLIQLRWRTRAFAPEEVQRLLGVAGFGRVERFAFASGPPSRTSMGYLASP